MTTNTFRLPTKEEFIRLCECYTRFDNEHIGRWFYDHKTGDVLFLPCDGYRNGAIINDVGSFGNYWSSTYYSSNAAYNFNFSSNSELLVDYNFCFYGLSVRLVSDEPFNGAVHVAGLYWKPENKEGYYTYNEAMEKFNNKNFIL